MGNDQPRAWAVRPDRGRHSVRGDQSGPQSESGGRAGDARLDDDDRCMPGTARILSPRWWCYEDVVGLRRFLPAGTPIYTIDAALYGAQTRRRVYVGRFPRVAPPVEADGRSLRTCLRDGPYTITPRGLSAVAATAELRLPGRARVVDADGKSQTVLSSMGRNWRDGLVWDGVRRRQLSFVECALLQGFPSDGVSPAPSEGRGSRSARRSR